MVGGRASFKSSPSSASSARSLVARREALALPRLAWAAFEGDLDAVRRCLAGGDDVGAAAAIVNQAGQRVVGVTALYLAAQSGRADVVRALLQAGADPTAVCAVVETGEKFTPADVALTHLNLRAWWLLRDAAASGGSGSGSGRWRRGGGGFGSGALREPLIMSEGAALAAGGAMAI